MMRDPGMTSRHWNGGASDRAAGGTATTISSRRPLTFPQFPYRAGEFRDSSCYADLWPVGCRRRAGRRLLSLRHRRPQISRFHQRHRRHRARPLPSASDRGGDRAGEEAVAHLEPVPASRGRSAGASGSSTTPSPTPCSSAIPAPRRSSWRSRWRASTSRETGHPERYRVIGCHGSFHGRTLCDLGGRRRPRRYLKGFGPAMEGFDHVAFGNLNEMRAAISKETAAILVEPVQGEGGVRAPSPSYLHGLRDDLRRVRPAARL